ncbi:CpaF family protein [Myxococcota bacterium]|nr:CpaF family protein [Myxococcota bacterium]
MNEHLGPALPARLGNSTPPPATSSRLGSLPVAHGAAGAVTHDAYQELKGALHRELVERLDLSQLREADHDRLAEEVRSLVQHLVAERALPLNRLERERIAVEVRDEVLGLGPLEPLLADASVSDILINGPRSVWVERNGMLHRTDTRFRDDAHLLQILDRIVSPVGRRVDETSPMVDARLRDGSRVNAIIPPLSLDGPVVSIRRFGAHPLTARDLVRGGTLPAPVLELLNGAVRARLNVLISGGTGSGKTTMLNVLSAAIPETERIVTIEDAAELQLQQPHVVRLETRPSNLEGHGEVTQRDLLRNALRMRPDRIVIGECRGGEALDMLQAMNTGHEGSMTTIHANTARDALARLETMIGMAQSNLDDRVMRQQVARSLDVVVQLNRLSDGRRRVVQVAEVTGMEGDVVTLQNLFLFEQRGVDPDGRVRGHFRSTGVRPGFDGRLRSHGVDLPASVYEYEEAV